MDGMPFLLIEGGYNMAQPFYTDGMTVAEILALGDDVLSKMNQRDLSRALRTVSLAANKRIDRLKKQAVKRKDGYVSKKSGKGIYTGALNAATDNGKRRQKFGASGKTRNQMYAEFARIRDFMAMKSSTVKGAVQVRKAMEKRAFGKTREEMGRGKTKKDQGIINRMMEEKAKQVYEEYRKFTEDHAVNPGDESLRILEIIGKKIIGEGASSEEARKAAEESYTEMYEQKEQQIMDDLMSSLDGGNEFGWLFE